MDLAKTVVVCSSVCSELTLTVLKRQQAKLGGRSW